MIIPPYADIDIWVGWFPSKDFLYAYLDNWLEGDPLPPAVRDETHDKPMRPMCQFSLDHDCSYYNIEMCSFGYAEKSCSVTELLQVSEIPMVLAADAAIKAESALSVRCPFNAFVALWAESFESPKTVQREHYELHYLGSFRHFYPAHR